MARKLRDYTEVGKRIAALARDQYELADVLGLVPQTVSKKLRGERAILLSDLGKLAGHYRVPLSYFSERPDESPELTGCLEKLRHMSPEAHELVCLLSTLPEEEARKLLAIVKVLVQPPT